MITLQLRTMPKARTIQARAFINRRMATSTSQIAYTKPYFRSYVEADITDIVVCMPIRVK